MTEIPGGKQEEAILLNKFDALVVALKKALERDRKAGISVPDTPAIDTYLEGKKTEAGSPPPKQRK